MDNSLNQQNMNHSFTCYFCNKLIENDSEFSHSSTCGSVLEPCINKCGSYVQRKMLFKHMKECKNQMTKSMPTVSIPNLNTQKTSALYHNKVAGSLATTLPNARNVYKVPKHYSPSNAYPQHLFDIQANLDRLNEKFKQYTEYTLVLKNRQQEIDQLQEYIKIQTSMQLNKLQYQNQIITEWKKKFEVEIEFLKLEIKSQKKIENELQICMNDLKSTKALTQNVSINLNVVEKQLEREQTDNQKKNNDFLEKIDHLRDYITEENAVIGALWNDCKLNLEKLSQEIDVINKTLVDNKTKYSSLNFDVKTISQISGESSDKLQIQERSIAEFRKELSQLKIDLQAVEEVSQNDMSKQFSNTPGKMIWKISKFSEKMESAKQSDTVLRSPIFYTHQFGYKIRLLLYLNGIKKWKGRHLIACIHVLKGEYDFLLKWPCYVEGTFTLKDLYNLTKPNNYSKYVSAKRYSGNEESEDPQESSTQFIFIPHTTLTKRYFLKDDTLFIELNINSVNKNKEETEL